MGNELAKALKRKTDAQFRVNGEDYTPSIVEKADGVVVYNAPAENIMPYVAGKNVNIGQSGNNKVINAIMNILAGANITVSAPDENGAVTISSSGGGISKSTLYTASGAISLEDGFATFDSTGGSLVMSLADGTPGQEVILKKVAGSAGVTIAPANFFDGQSLTLVNPRDSAILRFSGSHWHHVANFNATISESLEKLITIDHTKITSDLTNYPVMVNLSGKIPLPVDSSAVYFTDMSDVDLAFEREYYDSTTQKAVYHVKIPTVSSVSDTQFKVKWDGISDKENKTEVWDSDFAMVQHMGESLLDSTSNGNNGTNYGSTVVDGANGKARQFDGVNQYITVQNSVSLQSNMYSVQIMHKLSLSINSQSQAYPAIVSKRGTNTGWGLYYYKAKLWLQNSYGTGTMSKDSQFAVDFDTTVHTLVNLSHNGTTSVMNINGLVKETTTGSYSPGQSSITIGRFDSGASGNGIFGQIDELRISKNVRSASWIKADDHNLRLNNLITIS